MLRIILQGVCTWLQESLSQRSKTRVSSAINLPFMNEHHRSRLQGEPVVFSGTKKAILLNIYAVQICIHLVGLLCTFFASIIHCYMQYLQFCRPRLSSALRLPELWPHGTTKLYSWGKHHLWPGDHLESGV